MSDAVLTEAADGVTVVTVNRPAARNAVDRAVAEGIATAMEELDARDDLVVGVITGAGGTFSAGMDLKAFLAGELPMVEGRGFAGLTDAPPRKPLIAAVEGHVLAGGFEMVLACDLVVASEDARFGLPEVRRGLVAAGGGLLRLPQRLPYQIAMELALTGEFLDATRAHGYGLVNRLTAPGGALAGALELARGIAANGPLAVRTSKEIIVRSGAWPADEVMKHQERLVAPVFASEDAREGARAFTEKRAPRWKGR
ncbi:crotonase/enoyl-CoA hydratase family protein [Streptomyces sp. cg40]|uniref:crotonase/enoyl-CoA hydratase family protein n=1 Tax=Streptomyces sp. cg40 TaxID=3419764 RepID=UPI003CFC7D18